MHTATHLFSPCSSTALLKSSYSVAQPLYVSGRPPADACTRGRRVGAGRWAGAAARAVGVQRRAALPAALRCAMLRTPGACARAQRPQMPPAPHLVAVDSRHRGLAALATGGSPPLRHPHGDRPHRRHGWLAGRPAEKGPRQCCGQGAGEERRVKRVRGRWRGVVWRRQLRRRRRGGGAAPPGGACTGVGSRFTRRDARWGSVRIPAAGHDRRRAYPSCWARADACWSLQTLSQHDLRNTTLCLCLPGFGRRDVRARRRHTHPDASPAIATAPSQPCVFFGLRLQGRCQGDSWIKCCM